MSCGVKRYGISRTQMDPTFSSRFGGSRAGDVQNTYLSLHLDLANEKANTLDGFC